MTEFADRPALLLDFGEGPRRTLLLHDPDAKKLTRLVDGRDEPLAIRLQAASDRNEPYSLHEAGERLAVIEALELELEWLPAVLVEVRAALFPIKLFHCARPEDRSSIWNQGLHGEAHEPFLFTWATREAADEYRRDDRGSWADIWGFDDQQGQSRLSPSPIVRAGVTARVFTGDVPPDRLELVHSELYA